MNVIPKIVRFVKGIFFLPLNVLSIVNEMNRIDSNIDLLNQKIDNLNTVLTKIGEACLHSSQEVSQSSKLQISSAINNVFENHFLQIEALLSIYHSLPNIKYLPSTRGWAGSPDFLNKIVEIILKEKPRFVLEAGSGVSSVIIGLALQMNQFGEALSLDHDSYYAENTRDNLKLNGIEHFSTVKHCPIQDYTTNEEIWKWYNTEDLNLPEKIDMLVIDGPPRITQILARYPAIPFLHSFFADRVLILLDDAKRNDEVITVEKWIMYLENNNFRIKVNNLDNFEKGMIILEVFRNIIKI